MQLDEFHNGLRSLLNIDRASLPTLTGEQWHAFRTDPFRFFIRADDATAEAIWREMERRAKRCAGGEGMPAAAVASL